MPRYCCLMHKRLLKFSDDHWTCPEGHETVLAWDLAEHEAVELKAQGPHFEACPISPND